MNVRRSLVSLIASFALLLFSQTSSAVPMSFDLVQGGYAGGATITGMITVDDLDIDGIIEGGGFGAEVLSLMVSFSGNATVPAFVLGLPDLFGFVWFPGLGPLVGDDGIPPIEGIGLTGPPGTFGYSSGLGPTGGVGGVVSDFSTGLSDTSSIVLLLTPKAVPEPSSLALLGIALAAFAVLRRGATS